MKKMSKLLAVLLALVMCVSVLSTMAFADVDGWEPETGKGSITINGTDENHTYEAYQLFKGNLSKRQRNVTVGGVSYPEFSYGTPVVNVYKVGAGAEAVYKKVSDNSVVTPDATPAPVYEHMLRNIEWGANVNNAAIEEAYNRIRTNMSGVLNINKDEYATWKTEPWFVAGSLVELHAADCRIASGDNAGKYKSPVSTDSRIFGTERDWLEEFIPAELIATVLRTDFGEAEVVRLADFLTEKDSEGHDKYLTATDATATGTSGSAVLANLDQGYYLVRDKNAVSGEGSSITRYILQVAGDVRLVPKSSVPTVEKKVYENSPLVDTEAAHQYQSTHANGTAGGWNDVADYSIGQDVPFMLVATLPNTFNSYHKFNLTFTDTLGSGLTLNTSSVRAYIVNSEGALVKELSQADETFKLTTTDGIKVAVGDLKDTTKYGTINAGMKVIVEYTAKLNKDAVIGSAGNPNHVVLTYTNDPNWKGDGTEPTSPTKPDDVVVFTYQLDVTKESQQDHTKLAGAKFKLYSEDRDAWAKFDADGNITDWVAGGEAVEVTTTAGAPLSFKGLDDGRYQLVETVAPSGYNLLDKPVKFTIVADIKNTNQYDITVGTSSIWNAAASLNLNLTGEFSTDMVNKGEGNMAQGLVAMTVMNRSGNQLPVTGGMGTTLFYIVGGMMVIGAAVLLVTKKRMSNED